MTMVYVHGIVGAFLRDCCLFQLDWEAVRRFLVDSTVPDRLQTPAGATQTVRWGTSAAGEAATDSALTQVRQRMLFVDLKKWKTL